MEVAFFFLFFLRKGKEKCSRDLQEIVFHYRRLGDEREVFHPLGQTMVFFLSSVSVYARAHKRVHCGHGDMFKWQMMSDGKKGGGVGVGGVCAHIVRWWSDASATFPRAKVRTSLLLAVSRLTLCYLKTTEQHFATNVLKGTKMENYQSRYSAFSQHFFSLCHQMFWGLHFLSFF